MEHGWSPSPSDRGRHFTPTNKKRETALRLLLLATKNVCRGKFFRVRPRRPGPAPGLNEAPSNFTCMAQPSHRCLGPAFKSFKRKDDERHDSPPDESEQTPTVKTLFPRRESGATTNATSRKSRSRTGSVPRTGKGKRQGRRSSLNSAHGGLMENRTGRPRSRRILQLTCSIT